MMEKFGLDEEKARLAIEKGFRVEALLNGSAKRKLMEDSGIAGRIDRMKREVRAATESSKEGSP